MCKRVRSQGYWQKEHRIQNLCRKEAEEGNKENKRDSGNENSREKIVSWKKEEIVNEP